MEEENGKGFEIIKMVLCALLVALSFIGFVGEIPTLVLRISAAVVIGYPVAVRATQNLFNKEFFDENALMLIASVTAFALGESFEGVVILFLYGLGEFLEDIATDGAREKIAGLASYKSDKVNLIIDGKIETVAPDTVAVGSLIYVRKGEIVPIDGIVEEGSGEFDVKAITGESGIYNAASGEAVYAGSINLGNAITIKTVKLYMDSTVEKIIATVENAAERKAASQKFITSFAKIYTPTVVILALLLAVVPPLFDGYEFNKWIYKSLTLLIVSCPCAMVISVPLGFFIGLGSLAKRGVLVKGGNYIDVLSKVKTAFFDKTGTLTSGDFTVCGVRAEENYEEQEILKIAASLENSSLHPIAKAIAGYYRGELFTVKNVTENSGAGISGVINGKLYSVGKGQPTEKFNGKLGGAENNAVFVSEEGRVIGVIEVSDKVKAESRALMKELENAGIHRAVIISGDKKDAVEKSAREIGITEAYAELMPQDKLDKLSLIMSEQKRGKVLYCGDGVNDSPSIAMSDVGVAMGALGSEAAIDCADVVVTDDNPLKIPYAIKKAKLIKRKVITNIAISLAVKVALMAIGVFTALPVSIAMAGDVGVMLLAVLNSLSVTLYK